MDNLDKFADEIKTAFTKYVKSASLFTIILKDGSEVGTHRLILYALGRLRHIDSQIDK